MKLIFNLDGIRVWAGSLVLNDYEDIGIAGIITGRRTNYTYDETWTWKAFVRPAGWEVWLNDDQSGRSKQWDGCTFNLAIEVAAAFKR